MASDSKFRKEVIHSTAKDPAEEGCLDLVKVDDSESRQPKLLALSRTPGSLQVEFIKDSRSGLETWDFDKEELRKGFSELWSPQLIEILRRNKLISWKPSFPLRYRWSPLKPTELLLEAYRKERRDKFVTFNFPARANVLRIAQELSAQPEIDQAVAVPRIAPPSNPLAEPLTGTTNQLVSNCGPAGCLTNQWYLFRCDVPEAWDQDASGKGVVIAGIDWGFDLDHPDLIHTELAKNIFTDSPNVSDGNLLLHGNGVLGLAGAAVNEEGMAGIAFGASLWAIQAGAGGLNTPIDNPELWVGAINFVRSTAASGRKVIILEVQTADFGNVEMIPTIRKEIIDAINDQIVVCVPAGNGNAGGDAGIDDHGCPIPETGSIVVGATEFHPTINLRGVSNGGSRVTVFAPGDQGADLTCGTLGRYRDNFGGTSGATAKVAGVVALMLEMNDQLTPQQIREILKRSNKPVVDHPDRAMGVLLDANQAVVEAIALGNRPGTTVIGTIN